MRGDVPAKVKPSLHVLRTWVKCRNSVLHPHAGTMVETSEEVARVLHGSPIPLCLDTGHLLIGGTDPVELAKAVPDRIAHAHLNPAATPGGTRWRRTPSSPAPKGTTTGSS
jgi:sugar phosphate isomerase/epimerase